jgi:hypothetical protein
MRTPTAGEALEAWERGSAQGQAERGLLLLGLVHAGTGLDALADLSIGQRDGDLLALREAMFGSRIEGCANCPACGETMEMSFSTTDLHIAAPSAPALEVRVGNSGASLRRVTSRDLLALKQSATDDPKRTLLSRCVVAAEIDGRPADAAALPAAVIEAASQALAQADPQADIKLSTACAACGHSWQAPFDILAYLWTELDSWAARVLREVHVLACAYGWRESDILALSPARRKLYLDMAAS